MGLLSGMQSTKSFHTLLEATSWCVVREVQLTAALQNSRTSDFESGCRFGDSRNIIDARDAVFVRKKAGLE